MNAILAKTKKIVTVNAKKAIAGLETGKYTSVFVQEFVSVKDKNHGTECGGYRYINLDVNKLRGMM